MKVACPSCKTETEWTDNLDMERNHGWVWRKWEGLEKLLCPSCSKQGESIERGRYRKGAWVSERST